MEKFCTIDPNLINSHKFPFLKELEEKYFDLSLVTPLRLFAVNAMYLSRVSCALSDEVSKVCRESTARMTVVSKAPRLPCVMLTVLVREVPVYIAYLFSLSMADPTDSHTALPFMCTTVSKNQTVKKAVLNFIEVKFNCSIFPSNLSETHFSWTIGIVVNETLRRGLNDGITLSYFAYGNTVHLTLSDESMAAIWDTCSDFDPENNDVSFEAVQLFRESLLEHFLNTYQIDLSPFTIERVVVEGVSVSTTINGIRMRVSTCSLLYVLLKFIEAACVKPNHYLIPNWTKKH